MKPKLVVITGPTATGKTSLGIQLAQRYGGAVISADSRQVYAGMNRGTAKPRAAWSDKPHATETPDMVDEIEHYMLNIRRPDQELTLAEWQRAALTVSEMLVAAGRTPLLVGGTMLYVDSIMKNFSIPNVAPQPALREQFSRQSTDNLYAELVRRDGAAGAFIEPHNRRRIVRALEVMEVTGELLSALRQSREPVFDITAVGLFPGWEMLEHAVHRRTETMMADGLVAERQRLARRYGAHLPLLATLNYKEAPDIGAAVRSTLRYAHRQMSWWRGRQDITWFTDPESAAAALPEQLGD
jgi:tRNA dimethylallyltransferase